jgi:hypothetical protein
MDATRSRRIRDSARRGWYARWRSIRFARHFGFSPSAGVLSKPAGAPLLWRAGWFIPARPAWCRHEAWWLTGLAQGLPPPAPSIFSAFLHSSPRNAFAVPACCNVVRP